MMFYKFIATVTIYKINNQSTFRLICDPTTGFTTLINPPDIKENYPIVFNTYDFKQTGHEVLLVLHT